MGNQQEGQQYKKPQVPPAMPEDKDDNFKKQGVDQGKKVTPGIKGKNKADIDSDDDTGSETE